MDRLQPYIHNTYDNLISVIINRGYSISLEGLVGNGIYAGSTYLEGCTERTENSINLSLGGAFPITYSFKFTIQG